jgi:CheY-like chemotaxis protein
MQPERVIADLMMASLDGLALCDEIRAHPRLAGVKIVMVSARRAGHWRDQALAHGAAGYLTKPIDRATFAGNVEQLIAAA